jgi:hypothetical protein
MQKQWEEALTAVENPTYQVYSRLCTQVFKEESFACCRGFQPLEDLCNDWLSPSPLGPLRILCRHLWFPFFVHLAL